MARLLSRAREQQLRRAMPIEVLYRTWSAEETPDCFDTPAWALYREKAEESRGRVDFPCADCPVEHQVAMAASGRCANPKFRANPSKGRGRPEQGLEVCELDGTPVRGHLRCRQCSILVGPAHLEQRLHGSRCATCTASASGRDGERYATNGMRELGVSA